MPATDTSAVKIVINVVDANSGEVISRTVKNVDLLGVAAVESGKKVAQGMATASGAIAKADADAEKGSAAFAQRLKRMSAEHAEFAGRITRGQQQVQQAMSKSFTGGAGLNSSSFTNGMAADLKRVEVAGSAATKSVGTGFKEMGGHALTSLDNVRLLRDDLGIRIPRSMEKAIASSKALSSIIGGIGSGLLALGALELAFHVGKEIYDFYDKLTDVNKEVRKYEEGAAKASAQNLFAASDIETQLANLRQINGEVDKLNRKQVAASKLGLDGQFRQALDSQSDGVKKLDYLGGLGSVVRGGLAAYNVHEGTTQRDSNLAQSLQLRDEVAERVFVQKQRVPWNE